MSHLVLARKYRPKSFAQVLGQDLVVDILKAAIQKDRIAHAMLFTGGRGIGKTSIARIVAKSLVCEARVRADSCDRCSQCISVDNFSSLDVSEIDGASHTGVDDIRTLRDSARYQPTSAKYKIFIIDEVHMLSISAFNALLKILEEPPPHVIFIFATTEAHKIPKTILSRCQRYDFKRVDLETIYGSLKATTESESYRFDEAGLRLMASLADGSLRDGLSMAEQIISSGKEHYSAEEVARILGVVSHQAVKDVALALIEGQVEVALSIIKDVYESGLDICYLIDAVTERFRVLSLCAHVDMEAAKKLLPMLEPDDFLSAARWDKADLKRLFSMSLDAMGQVFQSRKPLLAVELFVLRTALRPPLSDAMSISYCLQKLDAIMHNRPLPKEPSPMAWPTKRSDVEPATPAMAIAQKKTLISPNKKTLEPVIVAKVDREPEDATKIFGRMLKDLAKDQLALASCLRHARPAVDSAAGTLDLSFEHSLYYEEVSAKKDHRRLKLAIEAAFGRSLAVRLTLAKPDGDVVNKSQKSIQTVAEVDQEERQKAHDLLVERAHGHPLVKKALEIFGGDITEVTQLKSRFSPDRP